MSLAKPDPIGDVAEILGHYVYLLIDPRDGRPFYVGKGRGERANSHEIAALAENVTLPDDPSGTSKVQPELSAKTARIAEIHNAGLRPEVWIARYGMTQSEYTAVEAVLIDVLSRFPANERPDGVPGGSRLTNLRREASRGHGLELLQTLIDDFKAPELTTQEPLLLIRLSRWSDGEESVPGGRFRAGYGFREQWIDRSHVDLDELALSTSCWWVLSESEVDRRGIRFAVGVYRGVTRGLFEIDNSSWEKRGKRSGFQCSPVTSGDAWEAVVGPHGHRVLGMPKGSQNPIRYWPFGPTQR